MSTTDETNDKKISFSENIAQRYKTGLEWFKTRRPSRWLIALVILLFLVFIFIGVGIILDSGSEASSHVYQAIGFAMIMVWVCIFICYFIWAVYFYNLNYGYSQKVWTKIEEAKQNRSNGQPYSQEDIDQEPKYNPYKDQTFGLPGGTVRGMIAFTLLFGSIAMLIVSFGMKNEIQASGFFIDQFDFFKKAFLMMIAFYFGTHSLKYLKPAEPVKLGSDSETNTDTVSTKPNYDNQQSDIIVIRPENEEQSSGDKIPEITAIDPMEPKG